MKRVDAAKQVDPRAINSLQGTQPSRQDSPLARRLVLRRLFAASVLMSLIVSCKGQGGGASSDVHRLIDESFALLLPVAASRFSKLPDASGATGSAPVPMANMDTTIEKVFGQWAAAEAPGAAIVSPLAAADFAARLASVSPPPLSFPPLVVPFASSGSSLDRPGIYAIEYDYETAYAAMGKKAAAYLARSAGKSGLKTICGFIFQENFMRKRGALEAFTAAFRAEAGEDRLVVQELAPDKLKTDPAGATQEAVAMVLGGSASKGNGTEAAGVAVVVLAIDNAFIAESAAAGASKGTLFLVDGSAWGAGPPGPRLFSYRIEGDQERLARAALKVARDLAGGRPAANITKVPLRYGPVFPKIF